MIDNVADKIVEMTTNNGEIDWAMDWFSYHSLEDILEYVDYIDGKKLEIGLHAVRLDFSQLPTTTRAPSRSAPPSRAATR